MSENKKIVVSLPQSLLEESRKFLIVSHRNIRNKFIKEAVISYIKERKKTDFSEWMKRGYMEMANLNSEIAEVDLIVIV